MKLNCKKWFENNLISYEIYFLDYEENGRTYTLIEYANGAPSLIHRHNIEKIRLITKYFEEMSPCDRLFKAREIALKHLKENRKSQIKVDYKTKKSIKKEIELLL